MQKIIFDIIGLISAFGLAVLLNFTKRFPCPPGPAQMYPPGLIYSRPPAPPAPSSMVDQYDSVPLFEPNEWESKEKILTSWVVTTLLLSSI